MLKFYKILAHQKFLADKVAGDPKNWPIENLWPNWPPILIIFNLNQKQKSYVNSKIEKSKFLKNGFAPPPFESEPDDPTRVSWDVHYSGVLKKNLFFIFSSFLI